MAAPEFEASMMAPQDAAVPVVRDRGRWLSHLGLGAVALLMGLLSVLYTGHVVGENNNVFHLPILARLYDLPQFADDPFIQSLRAFASGLWIALQGADAVLPAHTLLPVLLVLSRALTLLGAWLVARTLVDGPRGFQSALVFMALVTVSPLMLGTSFAGNGGLFVPYFTHSEVANGVTLFVWWAILTGRLGTAIALNGVVFFLNAFMGVWNAAPLLLWMALSLYRQPPAARRLAVPGLMAGAVLALLCAVPVVSRWVASGQMLTLPDAVSERDYAHFLREYFPYHFFADSIGPWHWGGIAVVLAIAVTGLREIGAKARPLAVVLVAYLGVYALGVVAPSFTEARAVLNLHLLRVSVNLHLMAVLVLAALTTQALLGRRGSSASWLAPLLLVTGFTHRWMLALVPLVLASARPGDARADSAWIRLPAACAATFFAGFTVYTGTDQFLEARAHRATLATWRALAQQIRQHTPTDAVLMLPPGGAAGGEPERGTEIMEYEARRRVWVDNKRGAAVMWAPSYLPLWHGRLDAVQALSSWPERLSYAVAQGITVVIDRCEGLPPLPSMMPVLREDGLCAVDVSRAAAAVPALEQLR